jgi:glycosyltransferase 2 family protein
MKRAIRLLLSLAVSVLLLWLAFRGVDIHELGAQLRTVDASYVLLYLCTIVVTQACRVFRWDLLIRPFAQVTTRQLLRVSNLGLMLILVLPLRLGELARPYLLKQETGASMSAGLGAVTVERAIDGLLVTLLFFITTQWLEAPYIVPGYLSAAAWVSLGIFGTAFVVMIGALVAQERAVALVRRLGTPLSPRLTERAVRMLGSFVTGLRALPDVRAVALFTVWTLVYWGANGLGLWWVTQAFGWALPPASGFVVVCVLVLGIMIPAGPGHLGAYHAALRVGLAVFGISATDAAAYGLIVYPLNVLVIVGAGMPYLFGRGRTNVRSIVQASSEAV